MDWYSIDVTGNNDQEKIANVFYELFDGLKVLESSRHVYSDKEKREFCFDHDAVSYHAAKIINRDEVRAFIILERHSVEGIVYKPYSEHDCPGQFLCPKSILDKLSPTKNNFALEWRRRAYEINEKLSQKLRLIELNKIEKQV